MIKMEDEISTEKKRKKYYTKNEVINMLKEKENVVKSVSEEICEQLAPFDVTDEEAMEVDDRMERLKNTATKLENKIRKLQKNYRERKFRHDPEKLEEKEISCSQYSIFQSSDESQSLSQDTQDKAFSPEEYRESIRRPTKYIKKPLNHNMSQITRYIASNFFLGSISKLLSLLCLATWNTLTLFYFRRRRVSEKRLTLESWAEEEGISIVELLGYLLHISSYHEGDRGIAGIGWQIFTGDTVFEKPHVSLEEATWMIEKGSLSQAVWQEYRLRLHDRIYLPPVNKVRSENQLHRPQLHTYRQGVRALLTNCLTLTLSERLGCMDLTGLDMDSLSIIYSFCWGLDGSGDHSNYHQLSKTDFSTKQIISVCFSMKKLNVRDNKGGEANWNSSEAGANKPQNVRPLALFPGKEGKEMLEEFIPIIEKEIVEIKNESVEVNVKSVEVHCKCEAAIFSMADGKMVTNLLQLGGAFCTMCTKSQEESQTVEVIEAGFLIDRSVEQISDLALSLTDCDTGELVKSKGDYEKRQGVCGQPLTQSDLTKNIPVCHSKIRAFDFIIEFLIRYLSHQKWWTPTNKVVYTKEDKEMYKAAREKLKEDLYKAMAINIGDAGDMVTGRAFQQFSSDEARHFLSSLVNDDVKQDFNFILLGLCATVKIINSQKRKVNVDNLKKLTTDVYMKLVTTFPWVVLSPSVHRILAHSWEVISMNNNYGLGDLSEEGLEALNKFIRQIREGGARKDTTANNFEDTYNHLWDRSRPTLVEMERVIKRKKQKVIISTEIEALVESLFQEEEIAS